MWHVQKMTRKPMWPEHQEQKGSEEEMELEIKVGDQSTQGFKEAWILCK